MVTLKRGPGRVDDESTKTDEDQKRFDPPGIASLGRPKATAGGQHSRLPHSATPLVFRNRSWGQTITADFEMGKRANLSGPRYHFSPLVKNSRAMFHPIRPKKNVAPLHSASPVLKRPGQIVLRVSIGPKNGDTTFAGEKTALPL